MITTAETVNFVEILCREETVPNSGMTAKIGLTGAKVEVYFGLDGEMI